MLLGSRDAVFRELANEFRALAAGLQEQSRRMAGVEMRGKVKQVDPKKALVRIEIGKDPEGGPVLSPWVPYKQTAGALKLHTPPSVGQVMVIRSETGDVEQGLAEPFRWSEANNAPSTSGDEHVLTFGANVKVTLKSDSLSFKVGSVELRISEEGAEIFGGKVEHNGHDIGDSHRHPGVERGGAITDPPL